MTPAEYLARTLDMTEASLRKPRIAPPDTRRSECCSKPPLERQEIDADGFARCGRCKEFAKFLEVEA